GGTPGCWDGHFGESSGVPVDEAAHRRPPTAAHPTSGPCLPVERHNEPHELEGAFGSPDIDRFLLPCAGHGIERVQLDSSGAEVENTAQLPGADGPFRLELPRGRWVQVRNGEFLLLVKLGKEVRYLLQLH